jgi:hypothetical protein
MSSFRDYLREIKSLDRRSDREKPSSSIREDYERTLSEAAEKIDRLFYPSAFAFLTWLRKNHPEVMNEIESLEERLQGPQVYKMDLQTFETLISKWQALHRQAAELFLNREDAEKIKCPCGRTIWRKSNRLGICYGCTWMDEQAKGGKRE